MFVIDKAANTGNPEEMKAIDAYNEGLRQQGSWVFAAGIGAPNTASIFDFRQQSTEQTAGSLFSDPEFYSGFWVIEAANPEQAKELAQQASHACNRKVELRPFL